jgi:hypothetical protein
MSETIANLAQKTARNAMQRVDDLEKRASTLEKMVPNIIQAVNQSLTQLNQQLMQAVEVLAAVEQILGAETIGKVIHENREARNQQLLDEAKARIAAEVEQGNLVPAAAVGPKSRVVFQEKDGEGKELNPGRAEFDMEKILEPFRTELQGKVVGDSLKTPVGSIFEIREIYDVVEKKAEAPAAEPQAPAPVPEATPEAQAQV